MSFYARLTLTVVGVLAFLAAAWAVRSVLMLVLIAAVLAVGLEPPVERLERLGLSRGWAVLAIFLAALGFIALFAWLVVPPLVREVGDLASNIPGYLDRLQHGNGWIAEQVKKYDLAEKLRSLTDHLPSLASASLGKLLGFTKSVASVIFNSLTIGILTIYFLLAMPRMETFVESLFLGPNRRRDIAVLRESLGRIGGYVSGNIIVSIIAGVGAFIWLWIFGVPFAAALAMWVAIADLIPTVGATLGAIVAVAVAFFSSIGDGVATTVYFVVYQQLENYVIVPRVMKKAVDLSPAAVIVSVLIGGSLAGFAGALLALPLAAAAKVVVRDMWLKARLTKPGGSAQAEMPAPADA